MSKRHLFGLECLSFHAQPQAPALRVDGWEASRRLRLGVKQVIFRNHRRLEIAP